MTWRRQPPVVSPVSAKALIEGLGAAAGFRDSAHESVSSVLRQRYGCLDALLTDSGTSALILTLRKLVSPGSIIALPAYACIDLTTVALGANVRVRLYDIDPATLSPDMDSLRAAIRRGVHAVVVAHLYGYPADVIGARELASADGVPVIEDAAQGVGGTLLGAPLGSLCDPAILSFGRGKGTTAGSGGAILVRTGAMSEWTQATRSSLTATTRGGMEVLKLTAQRVLSHPYFYAFPASVPGLRLGEMVYHPPRQPAAMSAASAAILRRTLDMEPGEVEGRRARAKQLLSRLTDIPNVTAVRPLSGGQSGFLRLALLDASGTKAPRTDLGALRGYPMTLDEHPQLQPVILNGEKAGNGARFLRDRLFTIPTHARFAPSDVTSVTEWLGGRKVPSPLLVPAT